MKKDNMPMIAKTGNEIQELLLKNLPDIKDRLTVIWMLVSSIHKELLDVAAKNGWDEGQVYLEFDGMVKNIRDTLDKPVFEQERMR